ncbi:MAG TPA: hypothetical protein VF173_27735 [Thermoanaerobaculia bacterium]|nr:hypothetical protein [Thermoanaerobaculia bacterium]
MDITVETLTYAEAAIRDILYLYVDMVESYGGFGHNLDTGSFSPLAFIDSKVLPPPGYDLGVNEELLHAGSSIALLCTISDCRDENGSATVGWPIIKNAKEAFDAGRFKHLPEIQRAFELGFAGDEDLFREQLVKVYQHYVRGYFAKLSAG